MTFLDGVIVASIAFGIAYFTVVVLAAARKLGQRRRWW